MVTEQHLDIVTYNKNALNNLRRAVVLGQGQFSLVLARVNYQQLREILIEELSEQLQLSIVPLPPTTTRLRAAIATALETDLPAAVRSIGQNPPAQAIMVTGLEDIHPVQLEDLLKAANLGRDDLPKTFETPVVLWVNDTLLQQLNRFAPDLKSFAATPIRFEYPVGSLIDVLAEQAAETFARVLNGTHELGNRFNTYVPAPLSSEELSFALAQVESQEQLVSDDLLADLLFLQGRNLHQQSEPIVNLERARSYYESSLAYWKQQRSRDKQAVLHFHLGMWWRSYALKTTRPEEADYTAFCERSRDYFEAMLTIFRQQNQRVRLAHFILVLAEILQRLKSWPALSAIAQEAVNLHQSPADAIYLARDYGYLAEVALAHYEADPHPDYLSEAAGYAQQAIDIADALLEQSLVEKSSDRRTAGTNLLTLSHAHTQQSEDKSNSWHEQNVLRYHRACYLYLLATAQQQQHQITPALENLEKARQATNARTDLTLYRQILDRLWHLYYEHKHYAQAFEVKLAQRRIESLFGLRAFIGAGQLRPARASDPILTAEIKASGREQDIEAVANRLSQPRYPVVVIHGQSGVGKSSTICAGLIPRLRKLISEGRTTCPALVKSYSRWPEQLELALTPGNRASDSLAADDTDVDRPSSQYLIEKIEALTRQKYQQIVLIFDQFEDFFYEYPVIEQRRDFYAFLRDCLNLPYVKVVLSLREDFLHYLLEWDRNADLSIIDNDILSKEIRYYIGNFMPKAAEMVIRQLTQAAGFYLEDGLVTALVDDLAADTGEVRPIELQVVGAQLQREKITSLEAYRQLGRSPKSQLLKNFLDNVIHDCGPENSVVAQSVLYLLSEGEGRPLKSHSEIEEALTFADIASEPQQLQLVLDILIGSGLIFEVPEVSGVRYQLVHEYLASLVQQQPPSGLNGLMEALQTERSRREQSETQLEAVLANQSAVTSASLQQTALAKEKAQIAEIRGLVSVARSMRLSGNGLGAIAKALRAAQQVLDHQSDHALLKMQVALCLHACLKEIREKNELCDHNNWVLAVDCGLSAIASASDDGTIKLWSLNGELQRTLTEHQAGVLDVRFSPDGQYLASASLDHTIRLWHTNGDFLCTLETPSASVTSIAFSPTEPLIAAAYSDSHIRLWNYLDGELVRTLKGHEDWARTVAFSPDGERLATGSEDQTVRIWHVDGELLHVLRGHQGWVRTVAFSPDGKLLLSAGDTNTLRLWSAEGRKLKTLYGHEDWVRSVAFSPDGQSIASGSDDQTIRVWGIEGTVQQTFHQRSSVHSIAWSADGGSIVSGGDDDRVHIWQLAGPPETICRAHSGIVWSGRWQSAIADEPRKVLSAGGDGTIKIWSAQAELLKSIDGHRRGVHSVAWSPKGDFFASASADLTVRVWTEDGGFVRSLTGHEASVWQVGYSPDGSRIASVSSDRTLRLWHPKGKLIKTYEGHTDTIWHVSFSPNSEHLITASEDNTLRLWHRKKGLVQTLTGHDGGVWCAIFSPNGQFLASGGADGVIRLWTVSWLGQQQIRIEPNPLQLKGHRDWVRSLRFSPNGEFLASASDDGTVRLWSLLPKTVAAPGFAALSADDITENSQLLPPLIGHEGVIWEVDFDAAGERLVTASADGTVRIWDLRLGALIGKGCEWLEDWLVARPEVREQLCGK